MLLQSICEWFEIAPITGRSQNHECVRMAENEYIWVMLGSNLLRWRGYVKRYSGNADSGYWTMVLSPLSDCPRASPIEENMLGS